MSIEQMVIEKLRALPPDKQAEVLDFAEYLNRKSSRCQPRRSLEGLWADFGVDITEADIAEARREMWGNFPRDMSNEDR